MIFVVAILSYLIGSLPSAYLLAKCTKHIDITQVGSGNSGTTNALRTLGKKMGALTLLMDFMKGILACLLGLWILGQTGLHVAGLFAVIGHVFSIYLKGKGGKGVATSSAVISMYDWRLVLVLLLVFVIVVAWSRYVSLGSLMAAIAAPVASFAFNGWTAVTYFILCLAVIVIGKHHQNILRLMHGNERKLGE